MIQIYKSGKDVVAKSKPQTGTPDGNSVCAKWCAANFTHPGADCTSLAARGGGPCYTCGPLKTIQTQMLCNEQCVDTLSDSQNCGKCSNVVSSKYSSLSKYLIS